MIPLSPALFMAAASAIVAADLETPPLPTSKRKRLAELDPIQRDTHGAGDYLRWSVPEARFVSASIVLWAKDRPPQHGSRWTHDLHLLQGSAVLSAVGTTVQWARQLRVRGSTDFGDRFLSWVDLDGRNATTSVKFHRRAA